MPRERGGVALPEPTIAEIREAMVYVAYLVEKYGDAYAPVLDRLEREFAAAQSRESPRSRAQRILQAHTFDGGLKAIR